MNEQTKKDFLKNLKQEFSEIYGDCDYFDLKEIIDDLKQDFDLIDGKIYLTSHIAIIQKNDKMMLDFFTTGDNYKYQSHDLIDMYIKIKDSIGKHSNYVLTSSILSLIISNLTMIKYAIDKTNNLKLKINNYDDFYLLIANLEQLKRL